MVAVALVVLVAIDTAVSGYLLACVRHLKVELEAQARVTRDLADCLADMDEEVRNDAE